MTQPSDFNPEAITDIDACRGLEDQFEHTCHFQGCPNKVQWLVWMAHARAGCPSEMYMCDAHKRITIMASERSLDTTPPHACPRCCQEKGVAHGLYHSPLHSFVRVVAV